MVNLGQACGVQGTINASEERAAANPYPFPLSLMNYT